MQKKIAQNWQEKPVAKDPNTFQLESKMIKLAKETESCSIVLPETYDNPTSNASSRGEYWAGISHKIESKTCLCPPSENYQDKMDV